MHTKTRILHHIALNPGLTYKEIAKGMGIKQGTVRVYLTDLSKDKKITTMGNHRWRLCSHISVASLRIPPEVIRPKRPWEIAYEGIMNMMRVPHVS